MLETDQADAHLIIDKLFIAHEPAKNRIFLIPSSHKPVTHELNVIKNSKKHTSTKRHNVNGKQKLHVIVFSGLI